jgi:hypothetical protein
MTLDDFLARMPKVELHCHLLGTVRRATFTDLARRAKAPISDEEMPPSTPAAKSPWACCACCARSTPGCCARPMTFIA